MSIYAHKTDIGAARQAYAMIEGQGLKIVAFTLGDGGHNNLNGNPITVDRSVSSLPSQIFGPSYNVENSIIDTTSVQVVCTLLAGQIAGSEKLSNIGLIAEIVSEDSDNGKTFLFAIANFSEITRQAGKRKFTIVINN